MDADQHRSQLLSTLSFVSYGINNGLILREDSVHGHTS